MISDSAGELEERISYRPYGQPRQSSEELYQFTSQEYSSELGIYDYNARQYNPILKRFLQADTVIFDHYNPQSLNRYSYTVNNPLKYTDPTGHFVFAVVAIPAVIGVVVGGIGYALVTPMDEWSNEGIVGHMAVGAAAGIALVGSVGAAMATGFSGANSLLLGSAAGAYVSTMGDKSVNNGNMDIKDAIIPSQEENEEIMVNMATNYGGSKLAKEAIKPVSVKGKNLFYSLKSGSRNYIVKMISRGKTVTVRVVVKGESTIFKKINSGNIDDFMEESFEGAVEIITKSMNQNNKGNQGGSDGDDDSNKPKKHCVMAWLC